MHRLQTISHATVLHLALTGLLGSAMALAQERNPLNADDVSLPASEAATTSASSPTPAPPSAGSIEKGEGSSHSGVSYEAEGRPLILQSGWKRTDVIAAYTFTGPTGQLFSGHGYGVETGNYPSSITAAATAYLDSSKITAFQLTADLEIDGQAGQMSEAPQGAGQNFTVEWGVSHLLSSGDHPTRALEIGIAGFEQWLVSRPVSLGGPFPGHVPGYSLFSAGLEATFTLPEKDMQFSLRYGREHLVGGESHARVVAVEFSWSW